MTRKIGKQDVDLKHFNFEFKLTIMRELAGFGGGIGPRTTQIILKQVHTIVQALITEYGLVILALYVTKDTKVSTKSKIYPKAL